jgi:hypothetical protein
MLGRMFKVLISPLSREVRPNFLLIWDDLFAQPDVKEIKKSIFHRNYLRQMLPRVMQSGGTNRYWVMKILTRKVEDLYADVPAKDSVLNCLTADEIIDADVEVLEDELKDANERKKQGCVVVESFYLRLKVKAKTMLSETKSLCLVLNLVNLYHQM